MLISLPSSPQSPSACNVTLRSPEKEAPGGQDQEEDPGPRWPGDYYTAIEGRTRVRAFVVLLVVNMTSVIRPQALVVQKACSCNDDTVTFWLRPPSGVLRLLENANRSSSADTICRKQPDSSVKTPITSS